MYSVRGGEWDSLHGQRCCGEIKKGYVESKGTPITETKTVSVFETMVLRISLIYHVYELVALLKIFRSRYERVWIDH
jgi:hypothetical protein